MYSFKDYILGTLLRHKAGALQDTVIIISGPAVLLALRWPLGHQLFSIHLRLVHFCTGEGHSRTFNANQPLYDFKSWAGIHKPLYQVEVAARQGLARPHPDYETLHGQFGRLVKLGQLLQPVAQGHRMFGPSILRP